MVQGVTPAHKGLAPSRLINYISVKIKKVGITKNIISKQFSESGQAISELLKKSLETGTLKGFKPQPTAFLGYIISHESHHRGQMELSLKQSGHPVDKKTLYGLWEWGTK